MRNRYTTDQSRHIPQLAGLGQDFFSMDYETTTLPAEVPDAATSSGSWFDSIARAAKDIVPAVFAAKSQSDLNEINLERARRGQPPLPASYLAATAPRINVGMAPDTQQMLIYGGLALVTVLALGMMSRR